jgi:hypothetical protein
MKTKYKFINFQKKEHESFYRILNNKSGVCLGYVIYYKEWKQWVFSQAGPDMLFSMDCLLDIVDFIIRLKGNQIK